MLQRIVCLGYPVSRLPDDLRGDFDPTSRITMTIQEKGPEGSDYETTVQDFFDLPHLEPGQVDPQWHRDTRRSPT